MAQLTEHCVPTAHGPERPAELTFLLEGSPVASSVVNRVPFPFLPAPNPPGSRTPTLHACLCLRVTLRPRSPPSPLTLSGAHVLTHTSVHRELEQRLQKAQKALYWRSLPPLRRKEPPEPHPEHPPPPPPAGPAQGREQSGGCLRKNRSLCTSDVSIAHKLGSALTPACGAHALGGRWSQSRGKVQGPVPSLTVPRASPGLPRPPGLRAGTCGRKTAFAAGVWIGRQEAPQEPRLGHRQQTSHFKLQACNSTRRRPRRPQSLRFLHRTAVLR